MTIAIYARVSKADSIQTPDNQLLPLREYCTRLFPHADVLEFIEIESSTKTRPVLDRMVRACQQKQIDVVIVWALDRLARSMQQGVSLMMMFSRLNIRFLSYSQSIDTDKSNAGSELMVNMLMAVAQFERSMIVDRVHAGLDRARAMGKHIGRPKLKVDEMMMLEAKQKILSGESVGEVFKWVKLHKVKISRSKFFTMGAEWKKLK